MILEKNAIKDSFVFRTNTNSERRPLNNNTPRLPSSTLVEPRASTAPSLPKGANVGLDLGHVDDASYAGSSVHVLETLVDVLKRLVVRDELVDPPAERKRQRNSSGTCERWRMRREAGDVQSALHVVLDDARDLGSALDSSERRTLPRSTGDLSSAARVEGVDPSEAWTWTRALTRLKDSRAGMVG